MKVFEMNESDHVAAESEEQAKQWYYANILDDMENINKYFGGEVPLTDTMMVSYDDLSAGEKPMNQSEIYIVEEELYVLKPFSWVIDNQNITEPCLISTTG